MKSFIVAILILALMIAGFAGNYYYLNNVVNDMCASLDQLKDYVQIGNWEDAKGEYKKVSKSWDDVGYLMLMLSNHTDTNKIAECMIKIREAITYENEEDAVPEIEFCKMLALDMLRKEQLTFVNVF